MFKLKLYYFITPILLLTLLLPLTSYATEKYKDKINSITSEQELALEYNGKYQHTRKYTLDNITYFQIDEIQTAEQFGGENILIILIENEDEKIKIIKEKNKKDIIKIKQKYNLLATSTDEII